MTTDTIVRKSFTAESKVLDAQKGLVEAFYSVTKVKDRQDDIIAPGAFTKAVQRAVEKGRPPTVVYGHDWASIHQVLGKVVDWQELQPGDPKLPAKLLSKGFGAMRAIVQFNLKTPAGKTAFELVDAKDLDEWSFAFSISDSEWDQKADARIIKEIDEVMEVSLVLIGANQETVTAAMKSMAPPHQTLVVQDEFGHVRMRAGLQPDGTYGIAFTDKPSKVRIEKAEQVAVDLKAGIIPPAVLAEALAADAIADALKSLADDAEMVTLETEDGITPAYEFKDGDAVALFVEGVDEPVWEGKEVDVPELTGDEAQHNAPLSAALSAINDLIAQELDEGPEYDCIIRLCCIAQDLVSWAQNEATESYDYMSAPPAESKRADDEYPPWMLAAVGRFMSEPTLEPVPDNHTPQPEDDPLMSMVKGSYLSA